MKTVSLAFLLTATVVFILTGCSDTVNPTQPSEMNSATEGSLGKATVVTTNTTIPYGPLTTFIPCASDYLTYQGEIHLVQHMVRDENGGLHLRIHRNL